MTIDEAQRIVEAIATGEPSYKLLSKWTELERWQAVCIMLVEIQKKQEPVATHLGRETFDG